MPVIWDFHGDVLALKYVGNPSTRERQEALAEAVGSAAFRPGMSLLFDTRSSISTVSSDELRKRVEWAVGLTSVGFRPRFAVVVDRTRMGIVDAGVRMVDGRVEIGIFDTMEEGLAWLSGPT
jgi:hypothetical protein